MGIFFPYAWEFFPPPYAWEFFPLRMGIFSPTHGIFSPTHGNFFSPTHGIFFPLRMGSVVPRF
jgi:hypothetical protein